MLVRVLCSRADSLCSLASSTGAVAVRNIHVGFLGAPFNRGQRKAGVKDGPQAIRDTGVITSLQDHNVDIKDYGDVLPEDVAQSGKGDVLPEDVAQSGKGDVGPSGERHHHTVLTYNRLLSSRVAEVLREGRVCVTLGGDHSIAIGTIHGHAHANPAHQVVVLWVDAHPDINTGQSSTSGNMHGMPVAHLFPNLQSGIAKLHDGFPQPSLTTTNLVYIGLRDVDPAERTFLDQLGILNYGMREVDRLGVTEVVARCLEHLNPSPTRPLHLSFDIDALDPLEAPSTGTPVRGGLSLREGLVVVEAVHTAGHLGAMDLVEVNPDLGTPAEAAHTAQAAKEIIMGALVGRNS